MAKTPSTMLPLGTHAPYFSLTDVVSNRLINFDAQHKAKASVIFFICNHCPYVIHINSELSRLAKDYMNKGVSFIAINSNDVAHYPADAPEHMISMAKENNFVFPYVFDETQDVARAYKAACTPDFYIFNAALNLVYRGQLDDSRPGNNIPVTGESIRMALDNILAGEGVDPLQKASLGCNIKWRA